VTLFLRESGGRWLKPLARPNQGEFLLGEILDGEHTLMSEEPLFNKFSIHAVLQKQTESVKDRIQSIPANNLLNASEDDLVQAGGASKKPLGWPTLSI
jgi:hypothetical protein